MAASGVHPTRRCGLHRDLQPNGEAVHDPCRPQLCCLQRLAHPSIGCERQLDEVVYSEQPYDFIYTNRPHHFCSLQYSLYELKQTLSTWFAWFTLHLTGLGFTSRNYSSLFNHHRCNAKTYVLMYMDDIILTTSSIDTLCIIMDSLHQEFAMTDLGELHHFLGVNVQCTPLILSVSSWIHFTKNLP